MVNPIDKHSEKLNPPLIPDEILEVYIHGKHKRRSEGNWIHFFGVEYVRSTGGSGRFGKCVSDISNECNETTNNRATLGALLVTMRWLQLNLARDHAVKIYNDLDYITEWLPQRIEQWCDNPDRPNRDLLYELLPYFNRTKWPRLEVSRPAEVGQMQPSVEGLGSMTGFTFPISTNIPIPDEALRELRLDLLKETVAADLDRYVEEEHGQNTIDMKTFLRCVMGRTE